MDNFVLPTKLLPVKRVDVISGNDQDSACVDQLRRFLSSGLVHYVLI